MMSLLMAATLLVAPAPTPALPASGPWTVDFADKMCAMARPYQTANGPITMAIKAPLVGDDFEAYVIRPQSGIRVEMWSHAFVLKPDGTKSGPFDLQTFNTVSGKRLARFIIDPDKYRLADTGSELIFHLGKEGKYRFAVPGFAKAKATLDLCTKNLRKEMGIDQAVLDRIVQKPKVENLGFKSEDYPLDAILKLQEGDTAVLAWSEIHGRVTGCRIIQSSGVDSIDRTTCATIERRTRFRPATDGNGVKLRSPVYLRVRWRLPTL